MMDGNGNAAAANFNPDIKEFLYVSQIECLKHELNKVRVGRSESSASTVTHGTCVGGERLQALDVKYDSILKAMQNGLECAIGSMSRDLEIYKASNEAKLCEIVSVLRNFQHQFNSVECNYKNSITDISNSSVGLASPEVIEQLREVNQGLLNNVGGEMQSTLKEVQNGIVRLENTVASASQAQSPDDVHDIEKMHDALKEGINSSIKDSMKDVTKNLLKDILFPTSNGKLTIEKFIAHSNQVMESILKNIVNNNNKLENLAKGSGNNREVVNDLKKSLENNYKNYFQQLAGIANCINKLDSEHTAKHDGEANATMNVNKKLLEDKIEMLEALVAEKQDIIYQKDSKLNALSSKALKLSLEKTSHDKEIGAQYAELTQNYEDLAEEHQKLKRSLQAPTLDIAQVTAVSNTVPRTDIDASPPSTIRKRSSKSKNQDSLTSNSDASPKLSSKGGRWPAGKNKKSATSANRVTGK